MKARLASLCVAATALMSACGGEAPTTKPAASANAMGARLAEGDVIAVQIPETLVSVWDWSLWAYDRAQGRIVDRATRRTLIPYNYAAFSVTRYEGA